ncbi:hypothetical protein JYG23_03885 [Sedimentibacter sp. zth1]|uniref:hypothetical protein n=1 Tax=Sedimentibacter sp. zth1 TaxID=2816908 RepID=UPI001A912BFE|nr:hypothetical protein [Sedimentibacter sp. zth1]QSX06607.1 hypothetical protein JYG23_03885 [Sedimentibacter sp. zth1]
MLKKNIAPIFALVLIIIFFIQPEIVRSGAIAGITLWYKKILPFLFPMFILSNILLQYSLLYELLEKVSKISKKLLGSAFAIIPYIIGIISGYPSAAVAIDSMVKSNSINQSEANYLLYFTNICSFQFISAVVVMSMLEDKSLLIYVTIPHFIGAIVLSSFFKKDFYITTGTKKRNIIKHVSFNKAFSNAITKSIISILTICGVIIIFSIISEYILTFIPTTYTSNITDIFIGLIVGALEITNGCNVVSSSCLPIEVKLILINFLISFSGFSIIFQTITVVTNFEIGILKYIKTKFVYGIISAFITVLMLIIM